jgi:sporulation protein YlmC with PRC-barrel domain
MIKLKYTVAMLALLCASGLAYAQESTPAAPVPEAQNKADCPAAGSVPEAEIPAGCKNAGDVSTAQPPASSSDPVTTGTTEPPKQDAATGVAPAPDADTAAAPAAPVTVGNTEVNPSTAILASQFMGQSVYTAIDENVGEINDLIMNKELDNIVAIVGVGGFLGIGERDVAIPIDDIKVVKDANNVMRLTISTTKEQLEALPAFDRTAMK